MRVAIPLAEGRLSMHFGHSEEFALIEVDREKKLIVTQQVIAAPEHEPGLLPRWLRGKDVQLLIAGGIGRRARRLFEENGIELLTVASSEAPEKIVTEYLNGTLETGQNICDH